MSNQVIIELVADPEGLKPAIDILKSFGTVSKEQAAAFAQAQAVWQTSIDKNTSALEKQAEAQQDVGAAIKNSGITVATGAIEENTTATQELTVANKALAGSYNDLKARMQEAEARFKNTGSKEAEEEYISLRAQIRGVDLEMRNVTKAMANNANQAHLLAATVSGMFGAFSAGTEIMNMFYGEDEEGAKKAAKAQQLLVIAMGLAEVARFTHEAGMLKTVAAQKLQNLQEMLGITTKTKLAAAEHLSTEATLENIEAKEVEIATNAEAIEAETALYTTKLIENGLTSESIAIRYAAAAAQWVLNAAMGPIGIAVVAVGALVAGYELLFASTKKNTEAMEAQNKMLEHTIALMKEESEEAKRIRDVNVADAQKAVDMASAQKKSNEDLYELKKKLTDKNAEYYDEEINNLQKVNTKLASTVEGFKGMTLGKEGNFKMDNLFVGIDDAKKALDDLEEKLNNLGEGKNKEDERKNLEAQINAVKEYRQQLIEVDTGIHDNQTKQRIADAEEQKRLQEDRLKSAKAYADARVLMDQKNSAQELADRKTVLDRQYAIETDNENLTAGEKTLLYTKLITDKKQLDEDYRVYQLNRDKDIINMQMEFLTADLPKRQALTQQLIEDERKLKVIGAHEDALLIEQINKESMAKQLENVRQFEYQKQQEQLKINNMAAGNRVAATPVGTSEHLQAEKDQIEAEKQLLLSQAQFTITNEREKQEAITKIIEDAKAKQKAAESKTDQGNLNDQITGIDQAQKQDSLDLNANDPDKTQRQKEAAEELELKRAIFIDQAKLEAYQKYADQSVEKEKEVADKILQIKKDLQDKENKLKEKQAKDAEIAQEELKKMAIDTAQKVSDQIFENAQQSRQNELKGQMDLIEAKKNAELLNTTLTASQRIAIEQKYKNQEAQAKLKDWKADQKAKEEQAIINGLLAFTMALAQNPTTGYITGMIALASAGVQAALIASKTPPKFATGTPGSMVTPAGMKWVGEKGPELIYTPGGEKIMTNADSMKFLEKYQIPSIRTNVDELLSGTGVISNSNSNNSEVVKAIGSLKEDLKNLTQVHNIIDENGFRTFVIKGGNKTEFTNNKRKN